MDDNLPPANDNQQPDNSNTNPPETPVAPPTITEEIPEPKMPETPPTPAVPSIEEEKSVTYPQPEEVESEPEPEESPIEIGSLGQPSFSSYSQETTGKTQDNSQKPDKSKSKKIKTVASVLGILLIITALPLSLLLVKQRQEIRKNAETPGLSGSVSLCGITVSPVAQDFKNGTYTFTYSVAGSGQKVEFHAYACACTDGNRGSCGTSSGECNSENNTLTAPFTRTITAPKIGDCGTYQGDVFILSVDGNSGCYTNR